MIEGIMPYLSCSKKGTHYLNTIDSPADKDGFRAAWPAALNILLMLFKEVEMFCDPWSIFSKSTFFSAMWAIIYWWVKSLILLKEQTISLPFSTHFESLIIEACTDPDMVSNFDLQSDDSDEKIAHLMREHLYINPCAKFGIATL